MICLVTLRLYDLYSNVLQKVNYLANELSLDCNSSNAAHPHSCTLKLVLLFFFYFSYSLPEQKAQMSFSDHILSVVCTLTFNIFNIFSRATGFTLINVDIKHP